MILVKQSAKIMNGSAPGGIVMDWSGFLELCARNCYKSEAKIAPGTDIQLIKKLIKRGHWTVFEFWDVTVRFICDRGISHELVRHRLCSFLQESSRYCDYGTGEEKDHVRFVIPFFCPNIPIGIHNDSSDRMSWDDIEHEWWNAMITAEEFYHMLRQRGLPPQGARDVLPNSLKTEVICKANLREWRHIFSLRCNKAAHPDMVSLMLGLLRDFAERFAPVFDDLKEEYL